VSMRDWLSYCMLYVRVSHTHEPGSIFWDRAKVIFSVGISWSLSFTVTWTNLLYSFGLLVFELESSLGICI